MMFFLLKLKRSGRLQFDSRLLTYVLLFFSWFAAAAGHANSLYPLDSVPKEAQFNHLLKDLRCLVCQNQDLADSNAELAKDLRQQVYDMVKQGKSDSEITGYLTERYGDFILFKPPVKPVTALLWFGPLLFLLAGLLIFWRSCFERARHE